jgi:flavin reductase (DIM6/NTAB) family NADH-FMN oxidoreductase RutF
MNFENIKPTELTENFFSLIKNDWMLVTAGNSDSYNTMTASWGGVGIMWNKPVAYVVIRPQRYTREFVDKSETLSLSFFDPKYHSALEFCGKYSGRDTDKAAATGLTPIALPSGTVAFEQARIVLECRKLYSEQLKKEAFIDQSLLSNYPNDDFHILYISEIVNVFVEK